MDMAPGGNGNVQALRVLDICGDRPACKVIGRLGPSAAPDYRARVAFVFLRDRASGMQKSFWNCDFYPRMLAKQCLGPDSRQWLGWEPPVATPTASASPAT